MDILADRDGWRARLIDFHLACIACDPEDEAGRIREAAALLGTIAGKRRTAQVPHEARAVEAMLDCGAHESAALTLIGSGIGYMLSRGPNGRCFASLVLVEGEEETIAEGATPALALLAAFVGAMLASHGGGVTAAAWALPDDRRLN